MPPVEDHPIHEKVRVGPDFRYAACQRKIRQPGYYVLTRYYFDDGRYELRNEWVPNTASKDCRYMQHDTDPACQGCPQVKDMEYINKMRELK